MDIGSSPVIQQSEYNFPDLERHKTLTTMALLLLFIMLGVDGAIIYKTIQNTTDRLTPYSIDFIPDNNINNADNQGRFHIPLYILSIKQRIATIHFGYVFLR